MDKERINLHNRYNDPIYLILVDDNIWELHCDSQYMRVIGEIDNIIAIDPPGGPMISVGSIIDKNLEIEKIEWKNSKYIVTSKNNTKNI